MSLTGKWKGYYEYGYGYGLEQFGKKVVIALQLTDDDGSVSGTCEEEKSSIAVDLVSNIQGFYEDRVLSFVKTYPKLPILNEQNEIVYNEGTQEVEHVGEITDDSEKLFGKWTIYNQFIGEDDRAYEYATEGIWFLERMEE